MKVWGTVYTDAVLFVTASVSMRLRLSFTRRRSSSLSEPDRFGNAFKSGAFSKRYGFIGRVNGETAAHRFRNGLERNWLAREANMTNLARSAALCCTITTLICGLTPGGTRYIPGWGGAPRTLIPWPCLRQISLIFLPCLRQNSDFLIPCLRHLTRILINKRL